MENNNSLDPILLSTSTEDMIDYNNLTPSQQDSRGKMIEFHLSRISNEPLDEFIRQVETININKPFSPRDKTPYGIILLGHVVRARDEAKIHYLLEKGVNPNANRRVARNHITHRSLVFGVMSDALGKMHYRDIDKTSRIIIDLIRHGAIFGDDEIDAASQRGYSLAIIDEWLTYVPEGQQRLAHILELQAQQELRDAYYRSRIGPLSLLAGTEDAINANAPGSELDYLTNPSDRYLLNHWINREIQTYLAPNLRSLQTRKQGGKRHSKKQGKSKKSRKNQKQ